MKQYGSILVYDNMGKVLYNTGDRRGWDGLKPPSISEEYPSYDPSIHGIMNLAYGEHSKDISECGSYEVQNGQLVFFPRLNLTVDKAKVISDGTDTATLSIKLPDSITDSVALSIDGQDTTVATDDTGAAFYGFSSTLAGIYIITVSHPKYGQSAVHVEVV